MSDAEAIFAVTSTLSRILTTELQEQLGSGKVSVGPLDKTRSGASLGNQLNLFLYGVSFNAAFRNQDIPNRVRSGESAMAPLALDLHYLLTAYGEDDDSPTAKSHILLGHAMRVFHDHAILSTEELQSGDPQSDSSRQVEGIRITPHPLSIEEISKLWHIFHTPYRVSAAYQVSVVLIDSTRSTRMPLPVLQRGKDDRGWQGTTSPLPSLSEARLPPGRSAAQLGDKVTLAGSALGGAGHLAIFTHARFGPGPSIPIGRADVTETALSVVLDETRGPWSPGVYTVAVQVTRSGESEPRTSNGLALIVTPTVTSIAPLNPPAGNVSLTIDLKPAIQPSQRIAVLFGYREIPVPAVDSARTRLEVRIPNVTQGRYVVRVRVDGVDSNPFALVKKPFGPPALEFLPNQVVIVT